MPKAGSNSHVPPAVKQACLLLGLGRKGKQLHAYSVEYVHVAVVSGLNSTAIVPSLDILAFSLVEKAVLHAVSHYNNVLPWRWVP